MIQTSSTNNNQLKHFITDNKLIQLTPREFYLFKQVVKFNYVIELIKKQTVFIRADKNQLESLGY